jgi:hypothetical protein
VQAAHRVANQELLAQGGKVCFSATHVVAESPDLVPQLTARASLFLQVLNLRHMQLVKCFRFALCVLHLK